MYDISALLHAITLAKTLVSGIFGLLVSLSIYRHVLYGNGSETVALGTLLLKTSLQLLTMNRMLWSD